VIVAHEDIHRLPERELARIRRKVTMVFQSGALFDSLTIAENILFSLELREDYDAENKEEVVNGLLKMVDLAEYADAYPTTFPPATSAPIATARALAAQPECILYDEPTTMVDPIHVRPHGQPDAAPQEAVAPHLHRVTHDLGLMYQGCRPRRVLHEGRVIFFGPTADLETLRQPPHQEFLALDRV